MEEKTQKSIEEQIKKMGLGDLVEEMCQQIILYDHELERSEAFSCRHLEAYKNRKEREENIRRKYEPILALIR